MDLLVVCLEPWLLISSKTLQFYLFEYHKFQRKEDESAEEWMGRILMEPIECEYGTHYSKQLKEECMHGKDDEAITIKII